MIEIRDLQKSYNNLQVLQGVGLGIQRGETITILGGSGTGKSVLLKLIAGLEKPEQGEIRIDKRDIVPLKEHEMVPIRRKIGMLFQGAALFDSLSAGENVAYPIRVHFRLPEEEIQQIVREKLRLVGLEGVEEKMPAELSGGMKKRVGLARAIAIDPEIILYDEPTTGLDPANTKRITHLIVELQRIIKVTSIVVTHDLDSAYAITDRLALLHRGRIAMVGTKEEFLASEIQEVQDFIAKKIVE
ncbi:MAG: ABC transporter ATP-binding protein [Deltaproteobacteria bacterium RBG_13_52_11]|nr:MAG: ABC transporter ATP-binding protein [Deltaproteobacteria bacterium RBG_13_52_11]